MTNVDLLLPNLKEYRDRLSYQVQTMREDYTGLEQYWGNFSAVYEGAAADQFRAGWLSTIQRFNEYMDATSRILIVLDEKIAELEQLAKADL